MIWRRDEPVPQEVSAEPGGVGSQDEQAVGRRRTEVRGMADQGGEVTIVGQGAKLEGTVV